MKAGSRVVFHHFLLRFLKTISVTSPQLRKGEDGTKNPQTHLVYSARCGNKYWLFILQRDKDASKAVRNKTGFACALKCCGRYLLISSSAIVCLCSLQMKYGCFYTQMDMIKVLFFFHSLQKWCTVRIIEPKQLANVWNICNDFHFKFPVIVWANWAKFPLLPASQMRGFAVFPHVVCRTLDFAL